MMRTLSSEWEQVYGHPVWFAETFVDPERYRGTCYRAANWIYWGAPPAEARTTRPTRRIARSRTCWATRSFRTSASGSWRPHESCFRQEEEGAASASRHQAHQLKMEEVLAIVERAKPALSTDDHAKLKTAMERSRS